MREAEFAILGSGALGSIIGAHLARAGHYVVMLARGRRATQILESGIRISGLVQFAQSVSVATDPSRLPTVETLIVATKTYSTRQALSSLGGAVIRNALSIQNGLMKNDQLAEYFGVQTPLGCLANLSGELLPSGEVMFTRNEHIYLGELDGTFSARAHMIANAIDASGVHAMAVENIQSLEWSKFAAWTGMMSLSVMTRTFTWVYLTDPGTALVLARLVREVGMLARLRQIQLSDQSVLPVATICRDSEERAVEAVRQAGLRFKNTAPLHRMSTLQDLESYRPLEIDETVGYLLRLAQQSNLVLPLMSSMYPLIGAISRMHAGIGVGFASPGVSST
jgi:2-dehydropantoate 2-reductase